MLGLALAALAASACPLAGERPMIEAELFFGRDIQGHAVVSGAQWQSFAESVLVKTFPDGFTVSDASGAWRDATGRIVREASKLVIVVAPREPALADKLQAAMVAYRLRFHQQSVGLVTHEVCAAF